MQEESTNRSHLEGKPLSHLLLFRTPSSACQREFRLPWDPPGKAGENRCVVIEAIATHSHGDLALSDSGVSANCCSPGNSFIHLVHEAHGRPRPV